MMYTMKKEYVFWASVCLLLSRAPAPLKAGSEEGAKLTNLTDIKLPPLRLINSFCALKADDGPCRAMMKRFFFNIHTQQCEEFVYGGCEGNQNRFESLEECKEKCTRDYQKIMKTALQKACSSGVHLLPDHLLLSVQLVCLLWLLDSSKFYFPPVITSYMAYHVLLMFLGFHGPSWCLTPADRGLCQANESRFYYNSNTGKCHPFKYSGCGGNENNFTSKLGCITTCKKGFIQRKSKGGAIKIKRKRKKPQVKTVYKEMFVKKI
ncbi:tissue factor pathway inhibitor [Trichechus inunguis]